MVEVVVRAVGGDILFGPAEVPETTTIADLALHCGFNPSYECLRCGCKTDRAGHSKCGCDSCATRCCLPEPFEECRMFNADGEAMRGFLATKELSALGNPTVDLVAVLINPALSEDQREHYLKELSSAGDMTALGKLPPCARCDFEIVLAAVRKHGEALRYAHDELRASKAIVLEAIKQEPSALRYADPALRADREVVLQAVSRKSYEGCDSLRYAHESLRGEKDIVLTAVAQCSSSLQYASASLRADRDVVLVAVSSQGKLVFDFDTCALEFAHPSLWADRLVVLAAVTRCGAALKCADESLRADRTVVAVAVENDGRAIRFAPSFLSEDKELVLKALRRGFPHDELPASWKTDADVRRELSSKRPSTRQP
eukprot:TRINITY_DN5117_c0_g1_i1.p1 TRINITY_DN5117_c0_g1~~TRINITY_DN5117_c0_g1_i1.p1  ORF type:complete len:372 (-),score=34.24 TRINITY_DN5117_c0_g1_i1:301-1416(-)